VNVRDAEAAGEGRSQLLEFGCSKPLSLEAPAPEAPLSERSWISRAGRWRLHRPGRHIAGLLASPTAEHVASYGYWFGTPRQGLQPGNASPRGAVLDDPLAP